MSIIIFVDLDHTIMTNPFKSVVFPFISQRLSDLSGISSFSALEMIMEEHNRRLSTLKFDRVLTMDWDDIIQKVAYELKVQLGITAEELVLEHAHPPYSSILDDAQIILRDVLCVPGVKLVVSSRGLSKYQFPVLRALGLYELFDDFLMPDLTGFMKFEKMFYRKYLSNEGILYISLGDNYRDDVICPKACGFRSILKFNSSLLASLSPFERPRQLQQFSEQIMEYPPGTEIKPEAVIIHLSELPQVIAALSESVSI